MKKIGKKWYRVEKLTNAEKVKLGLSKPEAEKPKKEEKKAPKKEVK